MWHVYQGLIPLYLAEENKDKYGEVIKGANTRLGIVTVLKWFCLRSEKGFILKG